MTHKVLWLRYFFRNKMSLPNRHVIAGKKKIAAKIAELLENKNALKEILDLFVTEAERIASTILNETNHEIFFRKYAKVNKCLESHICKLFLLNVTLSERLCHNNWYDVEKSEAKWCESHREEPIELVFQGVQNHNDSISSSAFVVEDASDLLASANTYSEGKPNGETDGRSDLELEANYGNNQIFTESFENAIHVTDDYANSKTPERCITPVTYLREFETNYSSLPSVSNCRFSPVQDEMTNNICQDQEESNQVLPKNNATLIIEEMFRPQMDLAQSLTDLLAIDGLTKHPVTVSEFFSPSEFNVCLTSDQSKRSLPCSLKMDTLPWNNHIYCEACSKVLLHEGNFIEAIFCSVSSKGRYIVDILISGIELTFCLNIKKEMSSEYPDAIAVSGSKAGELKGLRKSQIFRSNSENVLPVDQEAQSFVQMKSSEDKSPLFNKMSGKSNFKVDFIPSSEIVNQSSLKGVMSYVFNPGEFYVHLIMGTIGLLDQLEYEMNEYYENFPEIAHNVKWIKTGTYWAAKPLITPDDNNWYRVQVLEFINKDSGDKTREKVLAHVIDYGDKCELSLVELLPLTERFSSLPAFAILCSLNDVKPLNGTDWSEECTAKFTALVTLTHPVEIQVVKHLGENSYEVNLFVGQDDNVTSVALALHESGLLNCGYAAQFQNDDQPVIYLQQPAEVPPIGQWIFARISTLHSPGYFSLIFPFGLEEVTNGISNSADIHKDETNELVKLNQELNNLYQSNFQTNAKLNEIPKKLPLYDALVAAKSQEDDYWYRAVIVNEISDEMVQVLYIDFGSYECIPKASVKLLQEEFASLKNQATTCFLSGVSAKVQEGSFTWTEESTMLFKEMTADKLIKVKVVSYGVNKASLYVNLMVPQRDDTYIDMATYLVDHGYAIRSTYKSRSLSAESTESEESKTWKKFKEANQQLSVTKPLKTIALPQ